MTDLRYFEFYPANAERKWNGQHLYLRVLFGSGDIKTTGGGGGWEDVHRPYAPSLTVWRGPKEAYTHKIPVLLDVYSEGFSGALGSSPVDTQKREVEKLAGVNIHLDKGLLPEPPTLILDGYGTIPHDETSEPGKHTWIISEEPEWGELIRSDEGVLLRQAAVITFKIYEGDVSLERVAPKEQVSLLFASGTESYEQIALKQSDWGRERAHYGTKLARLNGAQNARQVPKHGTIRGPSEKELAEWKRGK